jgi:hypothetical protein
VDLLSRAAVIGVLLVALSSAPAVAEPHWSKPKTLSPPGGLNPQIALDARGNALVAWTQTHDGAAPTSAYRWWVAGKGWGAAHDVPRELGTAGAVAITPQGNATVLLAPHRSVGSEWWIATARPGGALGDVTRVTGAAADAGALGTDDAGNALVAWSAPDDASSVMVATRRAGGRFTEPKRVGADSAGGGVELAINPAGAAAVKWMSRHGGTPRVVYRPPGGSFGAEEDPGLGGPGSSRLGIDAAGRLVVASDTVSMALGQPGSNPAGGSGYAIRSPLGGWSAPAPLDAHGFVSGLLVEQLGRITFLIDRRTAATGAAEVWAVTRELDGHLREQQLSTAPGLNSGRAAMSFGGDVLASLQRPTGRGSEADMVVRERGRAGADFGPEVVIARSFSASPAPALNDLGQAVVAWTEGGRTYDDPAPTQVHAAVRDDPALRGAPGPPDVDLYADPLAELDDDGDLLVPVRCERSCKVRAAGIVFPGGGRAALAGSGHTLRLKARRLRHVRLDFGGEGASAVREALAAGARPWVSVTATARSHAPRPILVSRRYKLRP